MSLIGGLETPEERAAALPIMADLSVIVLLKPETATARAINTQVVTLAREASDTLSLARGLLNQGQAARLSGDFAAARAALDESRALLRELNEPFFDTYALWNLGEISRVEGDFTAAKACYHEALRTCVAAQVPAGVPYLLESFGQVAGAEGDAERAARLLGAARERRRKNRAPTPPFIAPAVEDATNQARAALGDAAFERAWHQGTAMSVEAAIADALAASEAPAPDDGPPGGGSLGGARGDAPTGDAPAPTTAGTQNGVERGAVAETAPFGAGAGRDGVNVPEQFSGSTMAGADVTRARALSGAGWLAYYAGDFAACGAQLKASLALFRRCDDRRGTLHALSGLAAHAAIEHDFESMRRHLEEALALLSGMEALEQRAAALSMMSTVALVVLQADDVTTACAINEEVLVLARAVGDTLSLARGLLNQGTAANMRGSFRAARGYLNESLALFRELNEPFFGGYALWNLGETARGEGDFAAAKACYREAMEICITAKVPIGFPYLLESYGQIAVAEGHMEQAARLLGAAAARRTESRAPTPPFIALAVARAVAATREVMGDAAFERAWRQGAAMKIEAAIDYGLLAG